MKERSDPPADLDQLELFREPVEVTVVRASKSARETRRYRDGVLVETIAHRQ